MRPFLLLGTRAEDDAAADEYAGFLRYGGLTESQLHRVRVEAAPLAPVDLEAYSGVIVGGSPFNASDERKGEVQLRAERDLTELVRRVVEADVPFLGACYGIGLLGMVCGGTVDRRYAEAPAATPIRLTEAGRADPLLAGIPDPFHAIVGHKEACATLPAGAVLLASSAGCPTQMFRIGRHVYATQFHPELDADSLEHRLRIYAGHGYCEPEEVGPIVAQARSVELGHVRTVLRNFVALARD
ncbi:Glutamine amidotransferase class-I [Serinicoccus hydrothermalis]|uniref:Glutamine amidotransferase class-I n=1 Tax=Serinicoccus hydrothermalis TaxID=1758689 RepID=A0A1B1NE62_9MICO|nr:glutamine amidotransferase [Serinicoccus hydrothermalis]ANS79722.1 Glutamine amidotransferase class-I [Serinicoccus hydrothermalis]